MQMHATQSSERLVPTYQTWHHIPEDCKLNLHFCEDVKSHVGTVCSLLPNVYSICKVQSAVCAAYIIQN
jgi:hypothetical protein